jgi:hypothetical protein
MDGKTVAIAVLILVAMLLGGIVATELRPEKAYAQGGVYATYLVSSAQVQDNVTNFVVVDTASHRMLFYEVDLATSKLKLPGGKYLHTEFGRKGE